MAIVRGSGGYLIEVDGRRVDVHMFRILVKDARAADHDDRAIALFEQALALWRTGAVGDNFGALGDIQTAVELFRDLDEWRGQATP